MAPDHDDIVLQLLLQTELESPGQSHPSGPAKILDNPPVLSNVPPSLMEADVTMAPHLTQASNKLRLLIEPYHNSPLDVYIGVYWEHGCASRWSAGAFLPIPVSISRHPLRGLSSFVDIVE